ATDRAMRIIRTRIAEFGVEEPIIQKSGDDRIIVELAGITDEGRAKEILQQSAFLEFYLVQSGREYQDFMNALPRIDRAVLSAFGPDAAARAREGRDVPAGESVRDLLFGGGEQGAADTTTGAEDGQDTA